MKFFGDMICCLKGKEVIQSSIINLKRKFTKQIQLFKIILAKNLKICAWKTEKLTNKNNHLLRNLMFSSSRDTIEKVIRNLYRGVGIIFLILFKENENL